MKEISYFKRYVIYSDYSAYGTGEARRQLFVEGHSNFKWLAKRRARSLSVFHPGVFIEDTKA